MPSGGSRPLHQKRTCSDHGFVAAVNRADLETASRIEHKIAQVVALLNDAIRDNEITAVQKVNPTRAATLADQMAEMQKSLKAIEVGYDRRRSPWTSSSVARRRSGSPGDARHPPPS